MRKTRKFFAMLLGIAMILGMSMPAFAAHSTISTTTQFFVQRYGVHMDEEGNVTSQSTSYFTASVFDSNLTEGTRSSDYHVVYKEGVVSSDDVISEVETKPDDAEILAKIKDAYNGGYILSSNGKAVKWDKFATDNYEMRWYVLKCEEGLWMVDDVWHVDGVVVEKDTQKPIEIVDPSDPGYTPPVYEDEDQDHGEAFEYTSNFAYIYGYSDNTMAADNNLRRSEVSAMVHRLVKQNNKLGGFTYSASNPPAFDDIAVGSSKVRTVASENRIVVPNTHESIISQKTYDEVQALSKRKKRSNTSKFSLASLVCCGGCKHKMSMSKTQIKDTSYWCDYKRFSANNDCFQGRIFEQDLVEILKTIIKTELEKTVDISKAQEKADKLMNKNKKAVLMLQKSVNSEKKKKLTEYIKLTKNEITEDEFVKNRAEIDERIEALNDEIQSITYQKISDEDITVLNLFGKYIGVDNIDNDIIRDLVKAIYVYNDKRIAVVWNFRATFTP